VTSGTVFKEAAGGGGMVENKCIFCSIAAGRAPASMVYQDSKALAFMDINPVNPGHVLVIPRKHAAFLADLDPDSGSEIFKLGMRLASAIRKTDIKCEAVNLILADGEAAGQEVFHVHLHVVPRYREDNFSMSSHRRIILTREELSSLSAKISRSLE